MTMNFSIRVGVAAYAVTPWLPGSAPPAHPGVYQRNFPAGPYSCWDGRGWRADAATPGSAARQTVPSAHPSASWRGLVEPAPGPCGACGGDGVVEVEVEDESSGATRIAECPDC